MKTLRKLLLVACAAFLFTSCEETYNDKLLWRTQPGIWLVYQTIDSGPDLQRRKTNRKICQLHHRRQQKGNIDFE